MGITDWKQLTVAGEANFRKSVQSENNSRFYWVKNWGWLSKEIVDLQLAMLELKKHRQKRQLKLEGFDDLKEPIIFSNPCPYPDTTNHEYGWLIAHPDWHLDRFGRFPILPLKKKEPPESQVRALAEKLLKAATEERIKSMIPADKTEVLKSKVMPDI